MYKVISKFRRKSYPFFISELKRTITTHDGDGNKNVEKAIDLVVKSTGVFHLPNVCGHFGGNVRRVKNAGLHSFPFPSKTSKWRPRYGLWQLVETRNWNAFLQDTFQSRKRASFSKFHLFPGISGIFRWNAEIRTEISIKWKAPDNFTRPSQLNTFWRHFTTKTWNLLLRRFRVDMNLSNLSPLKNRKKKERYFTFWWGFRWSRRRCCWSFLLFSTRSSCFNSNDVAFAS